MRYIRDELYQTPESGHMIMEENSFTNPEADPIGKFSPQKKPSRKVPWKVVIPVACVIILAVFFLFFSKVVRGGVYICTETSGGFITSGTSRSYYVTGIPSLKFKVSDNALLSRMKEAEDAKEEAYFVVTDADPNAYQNGKYDENYDLVFPYGESIYYHGVRGSNSIYEYNRTSGQIRKIPLNTNRGYLIGTDKTMMENITVLAILSIYPDLEKQIQKRKGTVWYAFYDERDGRVFYEQGGNIYEYLPQSKKSRLVYKAGRAENIRAVYSER